MAHGDSPVTPESSAAPAVLVRPGNGAPAGWLHGEHDLTTAGSLRAAIVSAADAGQTAVVVDLGGVEFMDSTTIGAILETRSSLASRGECLVLRRPSRPARRWLELCRLHQGLTAAGDASPHAPPGRPGSPPRPARHPDREGLGPATD